MFDEADKIIKTIIAENLPGKAVTDALKAHSFDKNIYMIAIGKAAWTMAEAAADFLGDKLKQGIVVTKYEHGMGRILNTEVYEAGHPVSDENTIAATQKCVQLAQSLDEDDVLLFLISGGGSALFELPCDGISLRDMQNVTEQLLSRGADIVEMNTVRKRLSKVKAGRFAKIAEPAQIFSIVLSDVLGDRLDTIASGPAAPDASTAVDAAKIVSKYRVQLTDVQKKYLTEETPKKINNTKTIITGSVNTLCESASKAAQALGYAPVVLTSSLNCEAREAGRFLAAIACDIKAGKAFKTPSAVIAGGETVVTVRGTGKGGRNQELAFAAAKEISGLDDVLIFSVGSDGTDGPTDAAGGMVNGQSLTKLKEAGMDFDKILADNDTYNGLNAMGGLVVTGPTGTNVNDVAVVLCK